MRILLIAPEQPNLNAVPEIRRMSEMHTVHVLNGPVTYDNVVDAVRHNTYDAIHFATHMKAIAENYDQMALSGGDYIDLTRAVQIGKLAQSSLVVLNLCAAARFGAFLAQRGIGFVLYTTVEIKDESAWSFPVAFYERIRRAETRGERVDYQATFEAIDSGDAVYYWAASPEYHAPAFKAIWTAIEEVRKQLSTLVAIVERHEVTIGGASTAEASGLNVRAVLIIAGIFAAIMMLSALIVIYSSMRSYFFPEASVFFSYFRIMG